MVEKIIVTPREIRGLGNIVTARNTIDYGLYNTQLTETSAIIENNTTTAYSINYRSGESLRLEFPKYVEFTENTRLIITAILYDGNGNYNVRKPLTLTFDDGETYTATTDSRGQATFNIPISYAKIYYFKVSYGVLSGQKYAGTSQKGKTVIGSIDSIKLLAETSLDSKGDKNILFATLKTGIAGEVIGVPGATVNFYEEYELSHMLLRSSMGHTIQDNDGTVLTAQLFDDDGSRIKGQTVYFYQEFESGTVEFVNNDLAVEFGDDLTLSVLLRNADGSRVSDETVNVYEEYTPSYLSLHTDKRIITDDSVSLFAGMRDEDGSRIPTSGVTVNFYEEYEVTDIRINSSESVIGDGVDTDMSVFVNDADGERLAGQEITLYEHFDYGDLKVKASKNPLVADDEITLTTVAYDTDGSRIYGVPVYLTDEIPSTDWRVQLDVDNDEFTIDNTVTLTATVLDDENAPVEDVHVQFFLEGDKLRDEVIIIEVHPVDSVGLTSSASSLTGAGEVTLTATVLDDDEMPIQGVTVDFYQGSRKISTNVSSSAGVALHTVYLDTSGTYTFKAVAEEVESSSVSVVVENAIPYDGVNLGEVNGKSVLSYYDGETATLRAQLLDGDSPIAVDGVSVEFFKGSTSLGTASTNSNGVATKTYTSTGAGDVSFTAVVGSFVSETYSIEDCSAYVTSFSNWIDASNKGTNFKFSPFEIPTNHSIELKFNSANATRIALGDANHFNTSGYFEWIYAWYLDTRYLYTRTNTNSEQSNSGIPTTNVNTNNTYRLEYDGTIVRVYVNDTLNRTLTSYDPLCLTRLIRLNNSTIENINYIKIKSL